MNAKNKQIRAIDKKCIHHRRTLGPEDDSPKMADGMPLGFSIVRVMNCPTCDNYKKNVDTCGVSKNKTSTSTKSGSKAITSNKL